jgi:nucleotide-binding universal stress UspA family protein
MYKHILFPTDGSPASVVAADQCVRFAAQIGARLTVLHVALPLHWFSYEPMPGDDVLNQWGEIRARRARDSLEPVEELAQNAQVPCDTEVVEADDIYEAIIESARTHGCDLIAMASHGRRGIKGVLVGSQTQKVLVHSALPVLVFR